MYQIRRYNKKSIYICNCWAACWLFVIDIDMNLICSYMKKEKVGVVYKASLCNDSNYATSLTDRCTQSLLLHVFQETLVLQALAHCLMNFLLLKRPDVHLLTYFIEILNIWWLIIWAVLFFMQHNCVPIHSISRPNMFSHVFLQVSSQSLPLHLSFAHVYAYSAELHFQWELHACDYKNRQAFGIKHHKVIFLKWVYISSKSASSTNHTCFPFIPWPGYI